MTTKKDSARVAVSKNGPYLVAGAIALASQTIVADAEGGSEAWAEGPAIKTKESYALCRCGQSKTKPFCDGTHAKIGFDDTETASRAPYIEQAKALDGPTMILTDADSRTENAWAATTSTSWPGLTLPDAQFSLLVRIGLS